MVDRFKSLFIIPPLKSMYGDEVTGAGHPLIGVAYMVSMLKQNDIDYNIIDMCLGYTDGQVLSIVNEYKPNLICLTSFSYGYDKAYALIENLKSHIAQPIVIGGPHVSAFHDRVLKETKADFTVFGEGEYTIIELINELSRSNPNFEAIAGLIWRQDSDVITNKERPYIQDLDSLPFPAYEDFELKRYFCYYDKRLPLITSRGCPYQCNFCSVRLSMGNRFRARSPENVVDEIGYWYKRGWNKFDFNDDTFTLNMNRAARICELILERGLDIKFQLYNGIRADRVDKNLLKLMKRAGCGLVAYGCESGNNDVLRAIKKGIKVEDVKNAVNMTREVGIRQAVNFIVGHPTETYEKAMESIKLAKELKCDFVNFYNLVPYPGTSLFQWISENENARFLFPMEVYLNKFAHRELVPVFETDEFPSEDRKKVLKQGFGLYEKKVLQFRLGKRLGYLAFLLSRNKWLSEKGRTFILYNKIGRRIFIWLSRSSR